MTSKIAVIGTGRMGSALAAALINDGHETHVWNRTSDRTQRLAALGAKVAATPQDAIDESDAIVVNLANYDISANVLGAPRVEKALAGKSIVQLSSGSPDQARASETWARAIGARYLDGAIMATPDFIGKPAATILYAGEGELYDMLRPALLAFGGDTHHVGDDVGRASALDAALLMQMWGALFGALQSVALCEAEGIPLAMFEAHFNGFKPVVDGAVVDALARVRDRRFASDESTLASIDTHFGAFRHALATCRERKIDASIPAAFDRFFQVAIKAGQGQDDFAALAPILRNAS